jgi:ankyrin
MCIFFFSQSGFTALHIACHCGHYEIAKLLLEHEANVEVRTAQGYMPLHFAAQQGHVKIIELLLSHSAPPDAVTKVIE